MKIDHAALYVRDLESAKEFFVRFFNARPGARYHNPKTDFTSYFLSFDGGARLEIMTRPVLAPALREEFSCGYAHLAFSAGGKAQVDELTRRLQQAGYAVISGPRVTGDGYYESCVRGLESNLIEITE